MAVEIPQIQMIKVSDLVPYNKNPRVNELAVPGVVKSIKKYGFRFPVLVDEEMVLISGHTRRLAAIQLKILEIPTIVAKDMSEDEKKGLRIADNRVAENSQWDDGLLKEELAYLRESGFDLGDTGFSAEELDCLMEPVDADCLDDLDMENVCGLVDEVEPSKKGKDEVVIRTGEHRAEVDFKYFSVWQKTITDKVGFATADIMMEVFERLGINATITEVDAQEETEEADAV